MLFYCCQGFQDPTSPINVVGVMLKGNDVARSITVRHYRDNNELPWISADRKFSNFFQGSRTLLQPVQVESVSQD